MSSKFLERNSVFYDLKFLLISFFIGIGIITVIAYNFTYPLTPRIFSPLILGILICFCYGYFSNSDIKQKIIFGLVFLFIFFWMDNFIGTFISSLDLYIISMILCEILFYAVPSFIFIFVGHFIKKMFNKK